MSYYLEFSDQTKIDIAFHKKAGDKAILKKLNSLLEEISEHPRTGNGQV